MRRRFLGLIALPLACAHPGDTAPPDMASSGAVGTNVLAPFDDVNLPHPTSRERLAQALRDRGFLRPDAPPGTQLGESIRAFQRSEGLRQTGWPDDETLRRLGIDPATKDRTLSTQSPWAPGATGASPSH